MCVYVCVRTSVGMGVPAGTCVYTCLDCMHDGVCLDCMHDGVCLDCMHDGVCLDCMHDGVCLDCMHDGVCLDCMHDGVGVARLVQYTSYTSSREVTGGCICSEEKETVE